MVWSDPLSLATTHGVSLPAGTEMFHFPAYPRNNKVPCRPMTAGGLPHSEILGSKPCWRLPEAYRILKRPSSVLSAKASTIRPSGRHTPRKTLMIAFLRQTTNHHTVKNDHKTIDLETRLQKIEPGEIAIKQTMTKNHHRIARVHYPVLKPPRTQATIRTRHTGRPTAPRGHPENRTRPSRGWRSGNPKAYPYHCPQAPKRTREANDLFHTSTPTPLREPFPACGPHDGRQTGVLKKTP